MANEGTERTHTGHCPKDRQAVARHQKEDHLAKGVYEGTNIIKRRKREEERGTRNE